MPAPMIRTVTAALAICMTAASAATDPATKPATRNRSEIPAEYRWNFADIYPDWDAWEAGMKELDARLAAFVDFKGTLSRGAAQLLGAYRASDELDKLEYRLYRYPQLQRDVDTRDQAVAARFQRVRARLAEVQTATAWFTPELLSIPEATVKGWIEKTPE